MISDKLAASIAAAATAAGIEPAVLVALVEIETNGAAFEADGRTPQFLFEKHRFYARLVQGPPDNLKEAVRQGLAVPHWLGHAEYADEGTSAKRLAMMARARAIDEEAANASASWGIGQSMGEEAPRLGFASATAMVRHMTEGGIEAQLDCLVREVKSKRGLVEAMNSHDWPRASASYNGKDYRANQYDTRWAAAWRRWGRKLPAIKPEAADEPAPDKAEIAATQARLRGLGYHEVGLPNGEHGSRTVGALAAFQHAEGLPPTGKIDDATRAALDVALPRDVSADRGRASVEDLKGSRTIEAASSASLVGSLKKWLGGVLVAGGVGGKLGLLDTVQSGVDKATQARTVFGQVSDLVGPTLHDVATLLFGNPAFLVVGVVLVIGGIVVERLAAKIIAARLDDHRTGVHAGPADPPGERVTIPTPIAVDPREVVEPAPALAGAR